MTLFHFSFLPFFLISVPRQTNSPSDASRSIGCKSHTSLASSHALMTREKRPHSENFPFLFACLSAVRKNVMMTWISILHLLSPIEIQAEQRPERRQQQHYLSRKKIPSKKSPDKFSPVYIHILPMKMSYLKVQTEKERSH